MANWVKDYTEKHPELVSKGICGRARSAIHFGRGVGETTAIITSIPVHYFDKAWKPIDTNLIEMSGGWFGAPFTKFRLHPDGRVKHGRYEQYAELPGNPIGLVDGDKIIRNFDFGQQRLILKEDGFRQEIEITRPPTKQEFAKLMAKERGSSPKGFMRRAIVRSRRNSFDIDKQDDLYEWLADAEYPVVIDPDFTGAATDKFIYGNNATYLTARSTASSTEDGLSYIRIGQRYVVGSYYCYRGYVSFDTSAIHNGAIVSQVNLNMTWKERSLTVDADFDVQIVKHDWSSDSEEQAYDNCLSGTADDDIWASWSDFSVNNETSSGNLDTTYVELQGTTYYSLRSSRDENGDAPTQTNDIYVYSYDEATAGYRPNLSVIYTVPARNVITIT
jgi:hypothetical protein